MVEVVDNILGLIYNSTKVIKQFIDVLSDLKVE